MQKSALSAFILCNFHVYKWEKAYMKDLNTWRFLMNFFMYLFRWRKGGGSLMHVYVLEHIVRLSYRTAWWIFTKLGSDEVLMVPDLYLGFSANSTQVWIQGRAKIGQWGVLAPKDCFFSNKLNMHGSDLKAYGKKYCYFWFHSEDKFLTGFWCVFGLGHFGVFLSSFYRFVCGKVFYLHVFCVISMFISGRMLI